jgi:hypothetical protein
MLLDCAILIGNETEDINLEGRSKRAYVTWLISAIFLLAIGGTVGIADDHLTPAVSAALNAQWGYNLGAGAAISALLSYSDGKNPQDALEALKATETLTVQELYGIAAETLKEKLWLMVAGSHTGDASCDAALPELDIQFTQAKSSLFRAAEAYKDKGKFTALAILLDGTHRADGGATRLNAQNIYRGCFSVNPDKLFHAVQDVVGMNH